MEPVNLKYLAKELGLATSTVSRALRNSHEISDETKQRVMAMAKKLNYEPNPYASSLRKQKSKTIGVIIPEIANNFFILVINGIEAIAREKNYHVLIYLTHEDYEREKYIVQHLQNGRVDGILMSVSSETVNVDHLMDLQDKGLPIVFFDRVCESIPTAKVTTDDYNCGYLATEHLIKQGCKNVAYFSFSRQSINSKRMAGYEDALKKYGIPLKPHLIVSGTTNDTENYKLIKKLLSSKQRPDGIFSAVEKMAVSTYNVCADIGLNIPNDIKIVSFSNLEVAPLLHPSLTTITQPAFDIGKEAVSILFKSLEKKNYTLPDETFILKSALVVRDSTKKSA
ncbi:LacI family DNA-binding transcriptional regulator [Danxiaibacter flavus]|uniref:LacI family DNA-binding transcriptional regulator n=1 Tax=Danxiaibacter flavus TaxID=3049108 RepID=A0ABV3ZES0_9BACT|nr:LacI family DNA-binding transcriptional regulator [Chitinophagaceae bacterium DXS]